MEYYVALSKRCEQALAVEADTAEEAGRKAQDELKARGDYDAWTVDEAYVVEHHATANE
jgi:hypothetical protein